MACARFRPYKTNSSGSHGASPRMITDPLVYAVAVPAVILYGLTKGGLAGVSLLAIPLMSLVMSPLTAAAVMLPVLLVQDAFSVWTFRRSVDRTLLAYILPGAAVGIGLAAATAHYISADHVRLAVGVLAIVFVANAWRRSWNARDGQARPAAAHAIGSATLCGALSGFSSFVIHAGGPPYSMYAVPRGLHRELYVGTSTMFFAVVNSLKLPGYLAVGMFTSETLALSGVLLPLAIAANAAGVWLVRRVPTERFFQLIYALTFAVGLKLVFDALRSTA